MVACSTTVDEASQLKILELMIPTREEQKLPGQRSLVEVHVALWANEARIKSIFMLLDQFPEAIPEVLALPNASLADLNSVVIECVTARLTTAAKALSSTSSQENWMAGVIQSHPCVTGLLHGCNGSAQAQLSTNWRVVLLTRTFIRDCSIPLKLPISSSARFQELLLSHGGFSSKAFGEVVRHLQGLATASTAHHWQASKLLELYVAEFLIPSTNLVVALEGALLDTLLQVVVDSHPCFADCSFSSVTELTPNYSAVRKGQPGPPLLATISLKVQSIFFLFLKKICSFFLFVS